MHGHDEHHPDDVTADQPVLNARKDASPPQPIPPPRSRSAERWLLGSLIAATVSLTAAIGPGFANAPQGDYEVQRWVQPLPLPEPEAIIEDEAAEVVEVAPQELPEWRTVEIKRGQTMGTVFSSLSLPAPLLHRLLEQPGLRKPLTQMRVGSRFEFNIDDQGQLRALRFERDEASLVTVHIDGDTITKEITTRDIQHRVRVASGVIQGSLFGAASKAGIGNGTVLEMAKVFGYDIDFTQDLRAGDTFSVVFDEIYRDGERLRTGGIIAASFTNQGKRYQAFRYTFADGRVEYFDQDGRPLKKNFLRVPVEFSRISSLFTAARKHPILGKMRAHKGVDYAARTGTPIVAAGDGRVSFAGWQSGYGHTLVIDHGRGHTTLYAHLSKFGKHKNGARVRQGDVIGYVGSSGLATGPHLHYEFRINGVHRDPLKVTLPKPEPLDKVEMARFREQTQAVLAQLEMLDAQRQYARK